MICRLPTLYASEILCTLKKEKKTYKSRRIALSALGVNIQGGISWLKDVGCHGPNFPFECPFTFL